MKLISAGKTTFLIDDQVAASWPAAAEGAISAAAARGDEKPFVRFRTESGSFGALPVSSQFELSIRDVEAVDLESDLEEIVEFAPGDIGPKPGA